MYTVSALRETTYFLSAEDRVGRVFVDQIEREQGVAQMFSRDVPYDPRSVGQSTIRQLNRWSDSRKAYLARRS